MSSSDGEGMQGLLRNDAEFWLMRRSWDLSYYDVLVLHAFVGVALRHPEMTGESAIAARALMDMFGHFLVNAGGITLAAHLDSSKPTTPTDRAKVLANAAVLRAWNLID